MSRDEGEASRPEFLQQLGLAHRFWSDITELTSHQCDHRLPSLVERFSFDSKGRH
jgi:hypothetical protein